MQARSEAQTRIQHHHGLTQFGTTPAPTRLHQQFAADLEWLEVSFPRFRPVLRPKPFQCNTATSQGETALLDPFESRAESLALLAVEHWFLLQIKRYRGFPGLLVRIDGGLALKGIPQQFDHRLFGLDRCYDPKLPQRFIHLDSFLKLKFSWCMRAGLLVLAISLQALAASAQQGPAAS